MKIKNLHFKWTVSRGRDTYGYNIVTLYVDGEKKGRCNGGGYDMQGTAFAQWLASDYQAELQELFKDEIAQLKTALDEKYSYEDGKKGKVYYSSNKSFYGNDIYYRPSDSKVWVSLDGACGFSSIETIANHIGITLKWNKESDRYKNDSWYTAFYQPVTTEEREAYESYCADLKSRNEWPRDFAWWREDLKSPVASQE
jgi:hypothetical protein